MRTWGAPLIGVAIVASLMVGCGESETDSILPTDGPNQVVIKVPSMT